MLVHPTIFGDPHEIPRIFLETRRSAERSGSHPWIFTRTKKRYLRLSCPASSVLPRVRGVVSLVLLYLAKPAALVKARYEHSFYSRAVHVDGKVARRMTFLPTAQCLHRCSARGWFHTFRQKRFSIPVREQPLRCAQNVLGICFCFVSRCGRFCAILAFKAEAQASALVASLSVFLSGEVFQGGRH